jgi:hypothetical protein
MVDVAEGDCHDNAVAESFFSMLEFELLMKCARRACARPVMLFLDGHGGCTARV